MSSPSHRGERRLRGFEAAAGLLRDRIRTAGESRGFVLSRLLTHWAEIVGEEVATRAQPVKVGYGKGGIGATLTLLVQGSAAPLVQMQLPSIQERVNGCYGYNAISRIHLTQTASLGFAEGQTPFAPAPKSALPPSDPAVLRAASDLSREVQDESLRQALEALGEKVLSRPRPRRG
ncbi:MAG: DciA family protein [Rhodobacteraceae bacterium]|nr:DciA family protein [Paracoccaceae bacterium]